MKPFAVQRKRTKGYLLPPNTSCVDRTTKYGNPFKVGLDGIETNEQAVEAYERWLKETPTGNATVIMAKKELRGKNLACFCSLDKVCHRQTLLRISNE